MTFGIVKHYNVNNGRGLIASEDDKNDIAVYQSEIDRAGLGQIAARQVLGFDIADSVSGPKAVNLWATYGNR